MALIQLTGGGFQDAEGNPLASGYRWMELSGDEQVSATQKQVTSLRKVKITLDANGDVFGTQVADTPKQYVWPNDQLTPSSSYYVVKAYSSVGQLVWGPQNVQVLSSPSPFDIGAWVPYSPNSSQSVVTVPTLQTNGTNNTVQSLLNLKNGTGISLTYDGSGGVAFNNTITGVTLKTNGVNNSSQSTLNLQQSGSIALIDNGSGNITIDSSGSGRVLTGTRNFTIAGSSSSVVASGYMAGSNTTFSATVGLGALSATQPPGEIYQAIASQWGYVEFSTGNLSTNAPMPYKNGLHCSSNYAGILGANSDHYPVFLSDRGAALLNLVPTSDPLTGPNVFIGFSSKNNGNWKATVNNGSAATSVVTSIAFDTNPHLFEIYTQTSNALFYIDGVLVATISTNIPSVGTSLFMHCGAQTEVAVGGSTNLGRLNWLSWNCTF